MSHPTFQNLCLLLTALCMASCGRTDRRSNATRQTPTESDSRATSVKVAVQSLPSIKEAILKAIDRSKGQNLFAQRSVEIAASKQPDGSLKVLFSVPTSNVMVTAGRKATKLVYEVVFIRGGVATEPHAEPDHERPDPGDFEPNSHSLARAASAVCSQLREEDEMEFAVRVSQEADGFFVVIERIPYRPGSHTGYRVSKDFEIKDTLPGT